MILSEEVIDMLSCPKCNGNFIDKENKVICKKCRKEFPIEDGVPNLLV